MARPIPEPALPTPFDETSATYAWGDGQPEAEEARERGPEPTAALVARRYRETGEIGSGGMGVIRRVWDTRLGRPSAMKIIRLEKAGLARAVERFVREARTTGRLQHPGIVPVHDMGRLADGRWWFTMQEIQGRTYEVVLEELHAGASPEAWPAVDGAPSFRRLVDALLRVCQTMAYAHAEGFVHRDLKPENVMLGRFGEVMVLDWGLGKMVGSVADDFDPADDVEGGTGETTTRDGGVLGSPPYMAPEQARGDVTLIGPATDVYALGAILYHLLSGVPPFRGRGARDIVERVKSGPPLPVAQAAATRCPSPDDELVRICERAMAREPVDRYAHAGELARALEEWLDGTRRAEEARQVVREVSARLLEVRQWRQRAADIAREATWMEEALPERPTEVERVPVWTLQDEAAGLLRRAVQSEAEAEASLLSAISLAPRANEAHDLLADQFKEHLEAAERSGASAEVTRWEALLRTHDRGRHRAWLDSGGLLDLDSDPPGAQVLVYRLVERQRRLVPVAPLGLGETPLREVGLPRGRLLVELRRAGHLSVRMPLLVYRGDVVDLVPPGESRRIPVRLPREGELGPNEVYVPPGWCLCGGDARALDAAPSARVWIDGFVIERCPVRISEYLDFLEDLDAQGRGAEAEAWAPALPAIGGGRTLWTRDATGRICLLPRANINIPQDDPELPIVNISWSAARAYAAWRARRDGLPWRLPHDLEWEKAARGADGRIRPWGDWEVVGRASLLDVHPGVPELQPVGRFPADESVYGVRDVLGNIRCFCGNPYEKRAQLPDGQRLWVREEDWDAPAAFRMVRGGTFMGQAQAASLASRFACPPDQPYGAVGIRLARPFA